MTPEYLIIHASASPPSVYADAAVIDKWHRQRGWNGNGYHAVITRSGAYQDAEGGYRTRPYTKAGAHVGGCGPGWNSRSIGICMVGGVAEDGQTPEDNFTEQQWTALVAAVINLCHRFSIPREKVMGHRDLIALTRSKHPKACPCFDVAAWLDTWWSTATTPPEGDSMTPYVVKPGDTLAAIARRFGVRILDVVAVNDIADINQIGVGQRLLIPRAV